MNTDEKLKEIAKNFPTRDELVTDFGVIEDYIRCQDIHQRDAERLVRLLRRKLKALLKLERMLKKVRKS